MGFISDFAKKAADLPKLSGNRDQSRQIWREVFGAVSKDEGLTQSRPGQSVNSFSRSATDNPAQARLLKALRTAAPGAWSDDRYEQTKHFTGVPYACIHRMGMQLMRCEFMVFQRDPEHPDGKRPVKPSDPPEGERVVKPYDLVKLLKRPNPKDHFGKLMYRWNQQINLTGTALTWMVPNMLKVPSQLYSMPTAICVPQAVVSKDYPHGYYRIQPIYPYGPFSTFPSPQTSVGAPIPAEWMLRSQFPHPLIQYEGYAPLTAMRLHIDEAEMIDRSRFYAMKRGINPSAVLNFGKMESDHPLPDHEIERIKAEFEADQMGPENHGKLHVAAAGGDLEPWGTSPVDMDYPQGWSQLVDFIMGAGFGITKPAAGMIEDASYATLFATLKQLHLLTLDPFCEMVAADLTIELAPFFGDDLIIEIRLPRIDDHDVKLAKLSALVGALAITKGELRRELEMPPFGDEKDDEIAGEPSMQSMMEQQEMQQQAMMGAGGDEASPGLSGQGEEIPVPPPLGPEGEESELMEEEEITRTRPRPGNLGRGALGPRKSLTNGNGVVLETRTKKLLEGMERMEKKLNKMSKNGRH